MITIVKGAALSPAPHSEMHPKSVLQIGYFYFPNRKTLGPNITIRFCSQIFTKPNKALTRVHQNKAVSTFNENAKYIV